MNFLEFLKPIAQNKILFSLLFFILSILAWFGIQQLPEIQKTTIYFSIKPLQTEKDSLVNLDPIESSMKVAEMIAGWAKNPAFRDQILDKSGIYIPNFKRKISAQKQNRTNVFWTIKLSGIETQYSQKIIDATLQTFEENFQDFNQENSFPFGFTKAMVSTKQQTIPTLWKIIVALFIGKIFTFLILYGTMSLRGKVAFANQVKRIFPSSPILEITDKIRNHNAKLLEQFILTFESPRLIGTFSKADKHFSLSPSDDINTTEDTPILLVKLGNTTINELKNLKAIFGENVGIVIFEK